MKKYILVFIFVMVNVASFGQSWNSTFFKADELTETEAYIAYSFDDPNVGQFVYWSNKKEQFRIITHNDIFNYESGYSKYSGRYCGFTILVGLYDKNDKLIEKFKMWLDCPSSNGKPTFGETRDMGKMSNPIGQSKKCKKIFNHLKTTGYIRILCNLYGGRKFDLKVIHQ